MMPLLTFLKSFLPFGTAATPADTSGPSAVFDPPYYLAQLSAKDPGASKTASIQPLAHYLATGWRQGFNPHPCFDVRWYLLQNPDVAAAGVEPFGHYLTNGWKEDRQPHPKFDGTLYLARNPKLLLASLCPLVAWNKHQGSNLAPPIPLKSDLPPADTWTSQYTHSRPYPYLETHVMAARIAAYRAAKRPRNKIAFYTCITSGYDTLRIPEHLSPDIDYFLFTDRPTDGGGVFEVRIINSREKDTARASRHVKLHPHHFLPDYDLVVWCDANVIIRGDLAPHLANFADSGLPLAFVPHPWRHCLYREAVICIFMGKDIPERIAPQMHAYQKLGYPEHHGLIEANFFACRPRQPEVRAFFEAWWDQLQRGSRRDQLSANYVLWKQGLTHFPLLGKGQNTRTHPAVALLEHGTYDADIFAAHGTGAVTHPARL